MSFINPLFTMNKVDSTPFKWGSSLQKTQKETCWGRIKRPVPIRAWKLSRVQNSKIFNGCLSSSRSRSPQHWETSKLLPSATNELATVTDSSDQELIDENQAEDQQMKDWYHDTKNKMNPSENGSVINNMWDTETSEQNDYAKTIFKVTKIDRKTNQEIKISKNRRMITHWNHIHAKYYAKGMWKRWYFSRGQTKKLAYEWIHTNRPLYATGMCKLWYLKEYHRTHERKRDRIKRL